MSFNVLASIAANDAASNASSSGTPIGVKILIGAFVVVIMLVGAWLAVLQQMRRQKWAESHGFRYIKADANLGKATRHVFGLAGRRHVARDVVVIPAAAGTALYYEVTWVERHGEDEEKKRCTFLRYSLPGPLPRMHIKPEGFFGLANNDINTEWQAFNKAFDVRSSDEQTAHALLAGPVQEFLMDRMRDYRLTFTDDELYLSVGRYKAKRSLAYGPVLDEFVSRVPAFVFSQE